MIDTLSTVGACPARLTATVVGSGSIETRPSILTGVVQTFIVFLKIKKKWRENQLNILFQMSGLETLKKYQQAILKYISLVQFSQGLIIDFGICMVNGSKKSKGLL